MNDQDATDDDIQRWFYGGTPPEGDLEADDAGTCSFQSEPADALATAPERPAPRPRVLAWRGEARAVVPREPAAWRWSAGWMATAG